MAQIYTHLPQASPDATRASIATRIWGGLGNQMFQYASGLGMARRVDVPLTLDLSWFGNDVDRPFLLDQWQINATVADPTVIATYHASTTKWRQSLAKRMPTIAATPLRGPIYREVGHQFHADTFAMRPPVLFDGYFQSERYFLNISDDVRQQFSPRDTLSVGTGLTRSQIQQSDSPVSLHVRRGDYVTNPKANEVHGLAPMDYYKAAIAEIQSRRSGMPHFFLFSDDPDWVREAFAFLPNKTVITGNDDRPWEDIVLMAACHDHIIANSTFSWWGAWLNPRADKTVIAPKRWFAGGDPKKMSDVDVVPPSWIRL
jgi:hypothetical protein